jgi:hypothetical protein
LKGALLVFVNVLRDAAANVPMLRFVSRFMWRAEARC